MKLGLKSTLIATTALITALVSSTAVLPTSATTMETLEVYIDDEPMSELVPITFEGQHILVPIRVLSEALGYTVDWDDYTQGIEVNREDTTASLQINNILAELNGSIIELDTAPTPIDGSTMVPLRFIARKSELGVSVEQNDSQMKISTTTPTNDLNLDTIAYLQTNKMQGSGIVLSSDGIIATNYHVIEGASTLQIIFNDGTVYQGDTTIVGLDAQKDIAILQIDKHNLTPATVNLQQKITKNDTIYTIGSPHGLKNFVSEGVILGSNQDSINMSALIDKGNSGGGLFHEDGNLLGMTYAFGKNQNLAIPIQTVANVPRNLNIDISQMATYKYKPTAPENLRYYTEGNSNYFTWSPVYGAEHYHVYISDTANGTFEKLYNTTLDSDIWYWAFPHAFGLGSDGQTVYLKISAVVDGVETEQSKTLRVKL